MRKPFVITILIRKEFFRNQEIRKSLLSDLARAGLSSKDSHGYKRTVTALASPVQHRLPRIPYPCPMKDLLRTEDLSRVDVDLLLDTAAEFATNPLRSTDALAHRTVAIYMTKPSTRTRLASESAVAHLGGIPIFIRGDELQIGRGETIADTAKVISGFASALIIRTFAQSDVDELGFHASIPVINALTDSDHPTQLLADWLTIREVFGSDISGRKFTYIGDGNNMAQAWLTMGAIMGAHVVVASPSGQWAPDSAAVARASAIAAKTGGKVEVVHDPAAAAKDSSVLYTDVWMSMGDPESDRSAKLAALSPFAVTTQLMDLAAPDVIFLHCLPAHRGEEVSAEVIDGPRSYIWRQAYHRRSTIQAILYHLVRGELQGSALLD
jgi:ornithine carbamoyltransferase